MISLLNGAMEARGIPPLEKLVLIIMADAADMDGWCCLTPEQLSDHCFCSVDDINHAIESLQNVGWLGERVFDGCNRRGILVCTGDEL